MFNIDLNKISHLLSQKLGRTISIVSSELIGSGYHSDGFRLEDSSGQNYFLKRLKSDDLGYELPERKVASLWTSDGMAKRAGTSPSALGVVVLSTAETVILPEINNDTEIYHLQEFEAGAPSYWSIIKARKDKLTVDAVDVYELTAICELLLGIHQSPYPSTDKRRRQAVYNDSLRVVLSHPELGLMFLQEFPVDHYLMGVDKQGEYLGLMMKAIYHFKNRDDRLKSLHGDFWGTNVFKRPDASFWTADYSRIPWGDPGLDVGWWLCQYLWLYHESGNQYFKELGELWFRTYEEKSGDSEIREAVILAIGLLGIIYITPRFYPDINREVATKFFDNVLEILRQQKFIWTD